MLKKEKAKSTADLSAPPVLRDSLRSSASRAQPPAPEPKTPAPIAQQDTRPLAPSEYAPLPVGALLCQRRYEVRALISSGQKLNVYEVEEDVEQRVCPQCGESQNRVEDQFCFRCGAELAVVGATRPVYLLKESSERGTFQAEGEVAKLKLDHPNIVTVRDAFDATPYGNQSRSYLVVDRIQMTHLSQLPGPHEEGRVLAWGVQLAQALEYLHQNHVAHQGIRPTSVVVDGDRARLTNLNVATVIPPAGRTTIGPQRYAEDVQELVQMLYYLLTGQEQLGAVSVSPAWARILNRATGPQRYQAAGELVADLQAMSEDRQQPQSVALWVGRLSHVGQVRELNEDSLLTLELGRVRQSISAPVGLYVVADGMGGHQGGEVASALCIQSIAEQILQTVLAPALSQEPLAGDTHSASLRDLGIETALREAVQMANKQIYDQRRSVGSDMGTTVVMALVVGDRAYLANVGDSRAYLVDSRSIKQISVDHSLIQRLIDLGQLTPEGAKTHPQRSAIYRVLGDKPAVDVDTFVQPLRPGQRLLLCSDGLNGMLEDDRIQQIVVTTPDPQTSCAALVEAANGAGGGDNVTVIVVQLMAT
jgi:serine/threonine protein phosphatase PrpC